MTSSPLLIVLKPVLQEGQAHSIATKIQVDAAPLLNTKGWVSTKRTEEIGKQPTASHPSVKGQRPQERWIGAHWESQETPVAQLPSFRLRSALPVTGVLSVGRGRRESILYAGAEPATRLLGRQHSDPSLQANEPSQLPAKTAFKFNIYTPAGLTGGARQRASSSD